MSKHPSIPRLVTRVAIAALCAVTVLPLVAFAEDSYKNEADFLAKAGVEWTPIAEGVYQKQLPDGQTLEHGFGRPAMMYLLETTRDQKTQLLDRGADGDLASHRSALLELDRTIEGLEKALAASSDEIGGVPLKSNCPDVTIGAQVSCSSTAGNGSASVFFADFGPCNQAVGSVEAIGSPGTQDTWSGSVFCYQAESASATCTVGTEGCLIYAFAEIDFTSCSDYQFRRASRFCSGPYGSH